MKVVKPVFIKNCSFNFCKYSVALLLWLAFILHAKYILVMTSIILGTSALLGVDRAPMVLLSDMTLSKVIKSSNVMLDKSGMRFAHGLGFILNVVCLIEVYINPKVGWLLVFSVAVLKSISAVGFCSGLKLYQCMNNDSCCSFIKGKVGH